MSAFVPQRVLIEPIFCALKRAGAEQSDNAEVFPASRTQSTSPSLARPPLSSVADEQRGGKPTFKQSARQGSFAVLPARIAVGLSGGPDSAALAICVAELARTHNITVKLLHVHHGLMPQADAWLSQVELLAARLDLELVVRRVNVALDQGFGLEASARKARYQALGEMAWHCNASFVLLAHHLQDQAETVLQRLFRGSGIAGMGGMRQVTLSETGNGTVRWVRPWLAVDRQHILECVRSFESVTGWQAVDDPSNQDPMLARGVIRTQLAPAISRHWRSWHQNLARHAQQAREASALLDEYGYLLLDRIRDEGGALDLRAWRALSEPQQRLALRTWLAESAVQMPSHRRLAELVKQLNQVHANGHDRGLLWRQTGCEIRCVRGKIHLQVTM